MIYIKANGTVQSYDGLNGCRREGMGLDGYLKFVNAVARVVQSKVVHVVRAGGSGVRVGIGK